jgi:hypothetical protein
VSAAQPNGLAALSAKRERARRSMPPPRHPVKTPAAGAAEELPTPANADVAGSHGPPPAPAAPTQPSGGPPDRLPEAVTASAPAAPTSPAPTEQAAEKPSSESAGAPVRVTLYVDRQADEFMEAARILGLSARPKVDISRSAVVRLAMRRLMADMTPEQVKQLLERQEVRADGPGRKLR